MTRKHLVIPSGAVPVPVRPGAPVVAERDGLAVASSWWTSWGGCILMLEPGPVDVLIGGDGRKETPHRLRVVMLSRDAYVNPDGKAVRATPHWQLMVDVRNLDHEGRVEWEQLRHEGRLHELDGLR